MKGGRALAAGVRLGGESPPGPSSYLANHGAKTDARIWAELPRRELPRRGQGLAPPTLSSTVCVNMMRSDRRRQEMSKHDPCAIKGRPRPCRDDPAFAGRSG